jgi:hypothetical protein
MKATGGAKGFPTDAFLSPPMMLSDWQTKNWSTNRWSRYQALLDFYRGTQWSDARRPGERRITINYARAFIQKQASYLMGKPLQFELISNTDDQAGDDLAAKCEQALREIWDDNGLSLVDYDAAVDAAVLGDGAFKVSVQPGSASGPLDIPGSTKKNTRIVVRSVDMNGLDAGFRDDDLRSLLWVSEQYQLKGAAARATYGADLLDKVGLGQWVLGDSDEALLVEKWTNEKYVVTYRNATLIESENPYGFIPYLIFPNRSVPRSPWGEADLEDVMPLASELNIRTSVLSQLLQMSGNPPLVLENVDDTEGLRVGPGAIWTLPEGSKAYLLELLTSGGVSLHMDYVNLVYKMLHDLSELPESGFGRDSGGGGGGAAARSGVALDLLLHPVVQRVNRKRRIWDEVLDRRNRMMLKLAGLPVHRSRIQWPDVLPKDRAAIVTQEVGLVASSIHSLETARRNLGDEQPEFENDMILEERAKLFPPTTGGNQGGPKLKPIGSNPGDSQPVKLSGALVDGLSNSGG